MRKRYSFCLIPGSFLYLHPGHIFLFEEAKKICSRVVIVLAHDKRIREKYNIEESTIKERKKMIEAIKYVDYVIEGYENEKDFLKVLELYPFDAVIFCKSHAIPKKILDVLKAEKNIELVILDCYKKDIFSTSKVLGYGKDSDLEIW